MLSACWLCLRLYAVIRPILSIFIRANRLPISVRLITTRKVIFTPSTVIKDELKNTSINITCYDKDGNVIKQVTSTDPGTVDEGDPEVPGGGGGGGGEDPLG